MDKRLKKQSNALDRTPDSSAASPTCTSCPPGKYITDDSTTALNYSFYHRRHKQYYFLYTLLLYMGLYGSCTNCGLGRYSTTTGNIIESSCRNCEAGKASAEEVRISPCPACPIGKSAPAPGLSACPSCAAGTYSDSPDGAPTCTSCAIGKYSSTIQSTSCSNCPSGTYNLVEGSVTCYKCAGGQKLKDNGNGCEVCPDGTFSNPGSTTCTVCSETPGYVSLAGDSGAARCEYCGPGFYADQNSQTCKLLLIALHRTNNIIFFLAGTDNAKASTSCSPCPPGTIPTATSCNQCEEGKYGVFGATVCTPCSGDGQYADEPGLPSCKFAPSGYKPTSNNDGIVACAKNTFSLGGTSVCSPCQDGGHSQPGSATCEQCLTSKYFDEPNERCDLCPKNTFATSGATNITGCTLCSPGGHSKPGSGYCEQCLTGKYFDEPNNECKLWYSNQTNAIECESCTAGYTSAAKNAECECKPTFASTIDPITNQRGCTCEPGYFLDNGICIQCQNGFFKTTYGTGVCKSCDKYAVKGAIQTSLPASTNHSPTGPCPEGVDCSVAGSNITSLNIEHGYWRCSQFSYAVEKCYNDMACRPNVTQDNLNLDNNAYCTEGHTGPLCNICQDTYVMSVTGVCKTCNGKLFVPTELIIFASILVGLGVAYKAYQLYRAKRQRRLFSRTSSLGSRTRRQTAMSPRTRKLSSDAPTLPGSPRRRASTSITEESFMQQHDKNSLLNRARTKFKILASFYQIVSQYEHVLQFRFPPVFEQFGRWVSSVANLDALKLVSFGCIVKTDYHLKLLFLTLTPIILSLLIFFYYRIKLPRLEGDERFLHLDTCMTLFLALTYLVFASVSTTLFKTFQCDSYSDDPTFYLVEDHQVDCNSAKHKIFQYYAAFMMVVYPFGITALYANLLFRKKEALLSEDRDKDTSLFKIAFLWEMYEPRENYNDHDVFGYLLIFINCAGIGLVVLEAIVVPIHFVLRRLMATHQHEGTLKGLIDSEKFSATSYWEYTERLLHSDEIEAGWQQVIPVLKDPEFMDWVNDYGVDVEWRCSEGDGPVDQIRANFTVNAREEDVRKYLLNASNEQYEDESERSIISSHPEKSLKRY
ncbi:hypothetical protein TrLO_g8323 [Triparma laevis f. longispina]|uniref:Tyrosine-protein kinase ephrin type A/B receptor-like domain-containing protein n=1 Tax=Triparma laevis f. longispina TaxID=1714387 RepID=A0A9W7F3Y3_9STRA|nr:hypothetical protein TrLO_g8323 [Triparma laevis f. longispina]